MGYCGVLCTADSLLCQTVLENGIAMSLTTPQDEGILKSWSLEKDYANNKDSLLDVGRIVYQALYAFGGEPPPTPEDLEGPLIAALRVNNVFKAICISKGHARPALYPVFARAIARHMLDYEWQVITKV